MILWRCNKFINFSQYFYNRLIIYEKKNKGIRKKTEWFRMRTTVAFFFLSLNVLLFFQSPIVTAAAVIILFLVSLLFHFFFVYNFNSCYKFVYFVIRMIYGRFFLARSTNCNCRYYIPAMPCTTEHIAGLFCKYLFRFHWKRW